MRRPIGQIVRALLGSYGLAIATLIVLEGVGVVLWDAARAAEILFGPYHGLIALSLTGVWFILIRDRIT